MLLPLLGLFGIQLETLTERVKRAVIVNAIVGILSILASTFLLVAGYLALAQVVGALYSALYIGAGFTVLAALVYFGSQIGGSRRVMVAEQRRSTESSALLTTAAVTAIPVILKSPLLRKVEIGRAHV